MEEKKKITKKTAVNKTPEKLKIKKEGDNDINEEAKINNKKKSKAPTLTRQQEINLIKKYQSALKKGDLETVSKISKSMTKLYLPFRDYLVKKSGSENSSALKAQSLFGLFKAINKFNTSTPFGFVTYGGWWALQYMQGYENRKGFLPAQQIKNVHRTYGYGGNFDEEETAFDQDIEINQDNIKESDNEKLEEKPGRKRRERNANFVKEGRPISHFDRKFETNGGERDTRDYSLSDTVSREEDDYSYKDDLKRVINRNIRNLDVLEDEVIRFSFLITPIKLADIFKIANEDEKQNIEKLISSEKSIKGKIMEEIDLSLPQVRKNGVVKKYLSLFSIKYKTKEISKIIGKPDSLIRKVKQRAIKKLGEMKEIGRLKSYFDEFSKNINVKNVRTKKK